MSVLVVFTGVILVTLSKRPSSSSKVPKSLAQEEIKSYTAGIAMMIVSLFCTGLLGNLQERTYQRYGPCWKEGVFYTVHGVFIFFLHLSANNPMLAFSCSTCLFLS